MRLAWAIVGGIVLGGGLAWWLARDTPDEAERRHARAVAARHADAGEARPVLYRWRDGAGVLQITDQPPHGKEAGRRFERVDMQPRDGIELHGDRGSH